MIAEKTEILSRNGKKLFAVIPYEAYVAMQEKLEDADDLLELRKATADSKGQRTYSAEEARRILNCPREPAQKVALRRKKHPVDEADRKALQGAKAVEYGAPGYSIDEVRKKLAEKRKHARK